MREDQGVEVGTHEFDDLTTDDIFHKVHGLRRRILDLAKDEHLKPGTREGSFRDRPRVVLGSGG